MRIQGRRNKEVIGGPGQRGRSEARADVCSFQPSANGEAAAKINNVTSGISNRREVNTG